MKRNIRAPLAFAAFLLIATFGMNASWAQTRIWRIGFLTVSHYSQDDAKGWPLYRLLSEHGWVVGKDVIFELRDGGGDPTRLAAPAAELVRLKVDMLVPASPPAVRAAFAATRDIPIVAHDLSSDPVDRENLKGREAGGLAHRAAEQVRIRAQSEDCQGFAPDRSGYRLAAGGQSDREVGPSGVTPWVRIFCAR